MKKILVTGINSDIGEAMVQDIRQQHGEVTFYGTFRQPSAQVDRLHACGCTLFQVDMANQQQVEDFARQAVQLGVDDIVFLHGSLYPIGKFGEVSFQQWQDSQYLNAFSILHLLNALLPGLAAGSRVISLAGGGVNGAPLNFSAYTNAKVILIKMTELLAAEYPDLLFFNLGPGFVKTKIHVETLSAGERAGAAFAETQRRLNEDAFVPMLKVTDALRFLLFSAPLAFSGRNFSAAHDTLSSAPFANFLAADTNAYKLRRAGNDFVACENPGEVK
ncbi:SDR family NAD(P)-dependent oxidoreductase [Alteromonas sp. RKMC-009]|uniref:SDR family NAD(P)-dependent oxidoreductase n=1 Tax=Alteromonas sp. RKMC-009 TaxID=2267264 RepID=UPI0013761073|nr:SDR family oxidoreductase [Alteromonas sp. RKMC-009]